MKTLSYWQVLRSSWKIQIATFTFFFCDAFVTTLLSPFLSDLYKHDDAAAVKASAVANAGCRIFQFLFLPLLGVLCDSIGRRFVMLLSLAGASVAYCMIGFTFSSKVVFLTVIGMIIYGATSGFSTGVKAHIADTSDPHDRPRYYALNDILGLFLPYVLAPLCSGLVLSLSDVVYQFQFLGASVLCFCCFVFLRFSFKESLTSERRVPFSWSRSNPFASFVVLWTENKFFRSFAFGLFFAGLSFSIPLTVAFFFLRDRFGCSTVEYLFSVILFAFASIVSCAVSGPLASRFEERKVFLGGLFVGVIGLVGCGLSPSFAVYCLFHICFGLFGAVFPMCSSLVSKNSSVQALGKVSSAMLAILLLSTASGGLAFATLYSDFSSHSKSALSLAAVWLIAGGLMVLSFIIEWMCFRCFPRNANSAPTEHVVLGSEDETKAETETEIEASLSESRKLLIS
eukprot:ANDGO_01272.mRNA.1 Tetracycline resistance protein